MSRTKEEKLFKAPRLIHLVFGRRRCSLNETGFSLALLRKLACRWIYSFSGALALPEATYSRAGDAALAARHSRIPATFVFLASLFTAAGVAKPL